MKIRSLGATFDLTKLIVTYCNFANAPKIELHVLCPVQFSVRITHFKIVERKSSYASTVNSVYTFPN